MAFSIVQHAIAHGAAGSATQAVTVSSTGSGNLLIAWVSGGASGTTPTGVSDGTNPFTHATGAAFSNPSGPSWESDVYYLLSSQSGKTTVTGTWTNTSGGKTVMVWEVSGATTWAFDTVQVQAAIQAGVSGTLTGPALTPSATAVIVAGTLVADSVTVNPKAGNEFTSGGDIASSGDAGCSLVNASVAAHTPQWTDSTSNDPYQSFTMSFKDTGGGATVDVIPPVLAQPTHRTIQVSY